MFFFLFKLAFVFIDLQHSCVLPKHTDVRAYVCVCIFSVHVVDSGYPALQNDVRVDVQVTDVNDHSPVFSRPKYYLNIPENFALEAITAIVAADEDSGENSRISYSIFGTVFF